MSVCTFTTEHAQNHKVAKVTVIIQRAKHHVAASSHSAQMDLASDFVLIVSTEYIYIHCDSGTTLPS